MAANFPQEIASFPFYATFSQILMAGVNANQDAQAGYIENLKKILYEDEAAKKLNYVEFNSKLLTQGPPATGSTTPTTIETDKMVKVPLIGIVDVRPMAIDKITADLSIKLASSMSKKEDTSAGAKVSFGLKIGPFDVHGEASFNYSSSVSQNESREYNLLVHMEASTQPMNTNLKNIITYLISQNPS